MGSRFRADPPTRDEKANQAAAWSHVLCVAAFFAPNGENMTVDYQTIIEAIDSAMATWAGDPVTIGRPGGRSVTYRTFNELIVARDYYSKLLQSSSTEKLFTLRRFCAR